MPSGWEFIKLSQIGTLCNGYTPKDEDLDTIGTVPYFKISDMNKEGNEAYLNYTDLFAINPKRIFPKNSIVFPKNGGAVFTNKKRILAQDSVVDLNTAVFIPSSLLDMRYAYTIFSTIDFNDFYKGTALPTIKSNFVNTKFYGLPPIAEQKRIIDRIEELFNQITAIEQNQADIEKLYDEFRKRTLTLAIQGKLVPQNPNDEPASVLLERIRAEKKAKLGKKYVDSYIYKGDDNCYYEKVKDSVKEISDEIPFEAPKSWQWIRIDNLFQHNTGKALNSSNTKGVLHPYITTSNVYWGYFSLDRVKEMPFTEDEFAKCSIVPGDLLVCEGGDVGRAAIWDKDIPMCIQNHIHRLRAYYPVCTAFYYFAFFVYKSIGLIGGKGIGIQGLSSGTLGKLIFPLPPLTEQERIVKQMEIILEKLKDED